MLSASAANGTAAAQSIVSAIMSTPVNTEEVFQAVTAALSPDASVRQQAEQYIQQSSTRPGYAVALLQVAAETQVDLGALSHYDVTVSDYRDMLPVLA